MRSKLRFAMTAIGIAFASQAITACHITSVEEDREFREQRSASFDASRYVDNNWKAEFLSELKRREVQADILLPALSQDLDAAGGEYGRRAGEGSAWTFVMSGEGQVASIQTDAAEGFITLSIPDGTRLREVRLLTGPVVVSTAVRDSIPDIAFNDFNDQLAFAEVGSALSTRALAEASETLENVAPGERVVFFGAFSLASADDPIELTPIHLHKAEGSE